MAQNVEHLYFLSMFDFNTEGHDDICCTICKKIMVEPLTAECGCQFCARCIGEYLLPGDKHCPGNQPECKDTMLIMNRNISKDFRSMLKISKTKLKCPHESCTKELSVSEMGEHLRLCELRPVPCPYVCVGCDDGPMAEPRIIEHCESQNVTHVQLLMSAIIGLRNDVNDLRINLMEKDREIHRLSEDCKRKETMIMEMKEHLNKQEKDVGVLKEKDFVRESEFAAMIVELEDVKTDIVRVSFADETCKQGAKKNINQEIHDNREFLWRINNFSKKLDGHIIRSCPMYRDSYKMYLCLRCNDGIVEWRCILMRGEFDNLTMKWPMMHTVTMSIMNQQTMKPYKQKTYSYGMSVEKAAYDRPTNDLNDTCIGDAKFMRVADIMANPELLVDDCILLSFVVDSL